MKKIIAVLLILACFGTAVFANPIASEKVTDLVLAGYEGNALASNRFNQEASPKLTQHTASVETNDLFADVQATALTYEEANQVQGDGFLGMAVGFGIGGVIGIFGAITSGYSLFSYQTLGAAWFCGSIGAYIGGAATGFF